MSVMADLQGKVTDLKSAHETCQPNTFVLICQLNHGYRASEDSSCPPQIRN